MNYASAHWPSQKDLFLTTDEPDLDEGWYIVDSCGLVYNITPYPTREACDIDAPNVIGG